MLSGGAQNFQEYFLRTCLFFGIGTLLGSVIAAVFLETALLVPVAIVIFATAVMIWGIFTILPSLLASRIRDDVERSLVNALYVASRLPAGTTTKDLLRRLSEYREFGVLQEIFLEGYHMYVKSGGRKGMAEILQSLQKRVQSPKFDRMVQTLVLGTQNNQETSRLLLKTAEDLEDIQELGKTRRASLALQKYTVLASSAAFVPFILGTTAACLKFFEGMGPAILPALGSATASSGAIGTALFGYSIIHAVLSSVWVAFGIDERPSLVAVYLPFVLVLNLTFFWLSGLIVPT